jgi:hypothetical protein
MFGQHHLHVRIITGAVRLTFHDFAGLHLHRMGVAKSNDVNILGSLRHRVLPGFDRQPNIAALVPRTMRRARNEACLRCFDDHDVSGQPSNFRGLS